MNGSAPIAEFEQRVRERAYAQWELEGRPAGRDAEHWRMSEEATRAELARAKVAKPKAARKTAPVPRKARSVAH